MAKKSQRQWIRNPKAAPKPKVPEATKKLVQKAGDDLMETVFKPRYVRPAPEEPRFNYIVDLHNKWHRNFFYFCSTYRCPSENCISEFFEVKYTRLEYRGDNQYNMAYMRHTGKWFVVYYDLTLEECLDTIQKEELFQP